jgi:chaperone modulatory protein CbpM
MASQEEPVQTSEVVARVSLMELCRISGCNADWVVELVEEGILEPTGPDRSMWQFHSASLSIVHRVRRLQVDLRINLAGVAVILTLVEENARLKQRLTHLEPDAARSSSDQ